MPIFCFELWRWKIGQRGCSVLDPPSIKDSGEIGATRMLCVLAHVVSRDSYGDCLMGGVRLLSAVQNHICLDDRTFFPFFPLFFLSFFFVCFVLYCFYYKHTETLTQVIQKGNGLGAAPGIWGSARWGPVQTHLTSVGIPVLSRILADTTFRCLFQPACFVLLWFYQTSAGVRVKTLVSILAEFPVQLIY